MRPFEAYTWQHGLPLVFFFIYGLTAIWIGRTLPDNQRTMLGFVMSVVVVLFMVGGSIIKLTDGVFDYKEDLPLYLCRIVAWMLPVVLWMRNCFWIGVLYFWILAGTLQGLITPDLLEGYPNYFYFRYWFLHAGLVVTILYTIIVFQVRIRWKDFWWAIGLAQVYLVFIHLTNLLLGSNYGFTVQKPAGGSILDFLGPWPWYVLAGEGMMVILFLLLMLPWVKKSKTGRAGQRPISP